MNRITFLLCFWLIIVPLAAYNQQADKRYKTPAALITYAEERGVRYEPTGSDSTRLTQLLYKLAYGVKDRTYFDYADKVNVPEQPDTVRIISVVNEIGRTGNWQKAVATIEPRFQEYQRLSKQLSLTYKAQNNSVNLLKIAVNGYRLLNRFNQYDRMVLINIPQGELNVIDKAVNTRLSMAVKVGTSRSQTPRFYTLIRQVNLYPYWTAPKNEIEGYLPKIHSNTLPPQFYVVRKKDSLRLDGNERKLRSISARKFNKRYWLKKGPGSDNPLGVVRINFLQSFEDIYLHDTNERKAFCQTPTALSHGCIRLQKPLSLANLLLETRSDWTPIRYTDQGCYQEPTGGNPVENKPYQVKAVIPVFIVYFPAFYNDKLGRVEYRDVYRKFGGS